MFNLLNSGAGSRGGRDSYNNGRDVDGGQRYGNNSQKVQELLQSEVTSNNYMRMMKRRWNNGDVYAPRDLSPYEMKGRNGGWVEAADVVDELGFSPLDNYRVCFFFFFFLSSSCHSPSFACSCSFIHPPLFPSSIHCLENWPGKC